MGFVSSWQHGIGGLVLKAIFASLAGIGLLLGFILLRRAYRQRYFRRLNARTFALRQQWDAIVSGAMPPETWRMNPLDTKIVETMVLDSLEAAPAAETLRLLSCLRSSGLLDLRMHEARETRGWRRRRALQTLGRMRCPETIPTLAEALEDSDFETRFAALQGLGRTELPDAAVHILDRLSAGRLNLPAAPLCRVLVSCCRANPSMLMPYLRESEGHPREILARALGELAAPDLGDDLVLLAADALPEVRASAARALGEGKLHLALPVLGRLASDPEWFVRLRAVAGLGALEDAHAIPALVETLADSNRYVRTRAAVELGRMEAHLEEILERVLEKHDRFAMQSLLSELERSGHMEKLMDALVDPARRKMAARVLAQAVQAGTWRRLLDALSHHSNWRVRLAIARMLAASGDAHLVAPLEQLEGSLRSPREKRVVRWIVRRLAGPAGESLRPEKVLG